MRFSPSSPKSVGAVSKARENLDLLLSHVERLRSMSPASFDCVVEDLSTYDEALRRYVGKGLDDARVVEIGYGARPYRLLAAMRRGVDACGVDMDAPALSGDLYEYRQILRRNGIERAAKTIFRRAIFDRSERTAFERAMVQQGWTEQENRSRFLVGDASELNLSLQSVDLIYSEDVFEHIEAGSLPRLVKKMRDWLTPNGLALIRPNIFTGIIGGHLLEWDRWAAGGLPLDSIRTEPWEHLRLNRHKANTFLNFLTRDQYRKLLDPHFEIVEERARRPELGLELLTRRVRSELSSYSDDELLSNQVLFVLRPR